MKKLLDPKWLFLINTLPILIVIFLGWREYDLIKSLLLDYEAAAWSWHAISLAILALATAAYAIVQSIRKKGIDIYYSVATLVVYIAYIYNYYLSMDQIIPNQVPSWMSEGDFHLYLGAFLMPTLLHALMMSVVLLTPNIANVKVWHNFVALVGIPIVFYVFGVLVSPLWKHAPESMFIILIIIAITLFLFLLLRSAYIILSRRNISSSVEKGWRIAIGLLFPLLGLFLNDSDSVFDHMFGDFSSWGFIVTAIVTGVLLCIPSPKDTKIRLGLFIGRCITFAYTTYFMFVFLPLVPFSVLLIFVFGLGLLMLTPLMLFMTQAKDIYKDVKHLNRKIKPALVGCIGILSFLVIPIGITIDYKLDRKMLHTTLDYLYNPDYSAQYELNKNTVEKTLKSVVSKGRNRNSVYSSTPYLSSYYKWLVLDNLNLSTTKQEYIKEVFNPKSYITNYRAKTIPRDNSIRITNLSGESKFDPNQNAWVSWIHLDITNKNEQLWDSEYWTNIRLPEGCWISDYYLDVEGTRKKGMLVEKKAAMWIFAQIRNENRDPGLLRYISGNTVEFKVFPFQKDETRYTGIEFIHKESVMINVDGNLMFLGDGQEERMKIDAPKIVKDEKVIYVSPIEKLSLPTVIRKPYYHFVVDISGNKDLEYGMNEKEKIMASQKDFSGYISRINSFMEDGIVDRKNARISYVNTYVDTKIMTPDWEEELKNKPSEGGFFLDRAIKKILVENYLNPTDSYPVIVVVTDNPHMAIMSEDLPDYRFTYPDDNSFYILDEKGLSSAYLFDEAYGIRENIRANITPREVIPYPTIANPIAYIEVSREGSVILNPKATDWNADAENIDAKQWQSGLWQQGEWMYQLLYPNKAKDEWRSLIGKSFKSGIMTPLTSYIVVETVAQEEMLKRKQEQMLNGSRNLDLGDDRVAMSEPEFYILLLLLAIMYIIIRRKKIKAKI